MSESDESAVLKDIVAQFCLPVDCEVYGDIVSFGNGHINSTYRLNSNLLESFVLQRINTHIFNDVEGLMNNVISVCKFLKLNGHKTLSFLPLLSDPNKYYYSHTDGSVWRLCDFVKNSVPADEWSDCLSAAFEAAKCFGSFQRALTQFPVKDLVEIIPNFHTTRVRYNSLMVAVSTNAAGRVLSVKDTIQFCTERELKLVDALTSLYADNNILYRIVHNDTKTNNVLLDSSSGECICVIDLDTVMPGLSVCDFGDLVRTGACNALEDEVDLSKVKVNMDVFRRLVEGYLWANGEQSTSCSGLHSIEIDNLVLAAQVCTGTLYQLPSFIF